ncbi:MAG: hypothetical protein E7620_01195 [Ruminococcaceae bacterium]|nr:hypothetical protein [Oscillospiraceae bacterium]
MKKAFLILLVIAMIAMPVLSVGAAEGDAAVPEKSYDVFIDFNTITELSSTATTIGSGKTVLKHNCMTDAALVKDGDKQVLYFPKTDTKNYGGVTVNPLTTAAKNYIYITTTLKVAKLTEKALIQFAYVAKSDANKNQWLYGWGIAGTADGSGELVCDQNANNNVDAPAAYDQKTVLAKLEKDRYYTITAKYDLVNQKLSLYLDGVEVASDKTFMNQSNTATYEGQKVNAPYRFTQFHMYQGEYEVYYANMGVYSSNTVEYPYEYKIPDSEMQEYKASAKTELETTVPDMNVYRDAQKTEVEAIIAEGKAAIDAAADSDAVQAALAAAKAKLQAVKTNAQLTAEEKLAAAKTSAKETLATFVKLEDYSAANQAAITELLTKFNTDIDAQTTEDGVSKIVSSAKNKLLDFATLADEALAAKMESAVAELEAFVDLSTLDAAVKASVEDAIEEGIEAIETAEDEAGVDAALAAAKTAITNLLPKATEAPTTEAPTEKKGCGASVAVSAILLPLLGVGVLLKKSKKED